MEQQRQQPNTECHVKNFLQKKNTNQFVFFVYDASTRTQFPDNFKKYIFEVFSYYFDDDSFFCESCHIFLLCKHIFHSAKSQAKKATNNKLNKPNPFIHVIIMRVCSFSRCKTYRHPADKTTITRHWWWWQFCEKRRKWDHFLKRWCCFCIFVPSTYMISTTSICCNSHKKISIF